jgi:hypothetical protein
LTSEEVTEEAVVEESSVAEVAPAMEEAVVAPIVDLEPEVGPSLEAVETKVSVEPAGVEPEVEAVALEEEPDMEWAEAELYEEGDEEDELLSEATRKKARDKKKRRLLEFDERLGRVVARKKHRRDRRILSWGDEDEDYS